MGDRYDPRPSPRAAMAGNREATILATTVLVVVGAIVAIAWGARQLEVIGVPTLGAVGMPIASIGLVIAAALLDRRRARSLVAVAAFAIAIVIGLDAATHRSAGWPGVMPELAIGATFLLAAIVTVEGFALAKRATERFWLRYLIATVAGGAVWALIELPAASLICAALVVACAPVSVIVWIARSMLVVPDAVIVHDIRPRLVARSVVPPPALPAAPRRQYSTEEIAFFEEGDLYSITGARADVTARTSIAEL